MSRYTPDSFVLKVDTQVGKKSFNISFDSFIRNGDVIKLLYKNIPIKFSSKIVIKRMEDELFCELIVGNESYKVKTWDIVYEIYTTRHKVGTLLVNKRVYDVDQFLYFEFKDWFQYPHIGVWVLTQQYPAINIYGWTEEPFKLLINNIIDRYDDIESLLEDISNTSLFSQYILLADDYYQTQWLINNGVAKDYSYLEGLRDSYIGKDNPPSPILCPKWWNVDYSHSNFSGMDYLKAKNEELDYIMRNISPTRETAEAILNQAITFNIPVTQVIL